MEPNQRATPSTTVWGRSLRFVLVNELMAAGGPVSVAEMVRFISDAGYSLEGRPSKVISDALRWEIRRGRVVRLGRGIYQYRSAPPSTSRRIRLLGRRARAWVDDVLAGRTPPRSPPDPRRHVSSPPFDPHDPPWFNLGWLWAS